MDDLISLITLALVTIIIVLVYSLMPAKVVPKLTENDVNHNWCGVTSFNYSGTYSEFVSPEIGKKLFKNNCATCHAKNMVSEATGPPLSESFKNWEKDSTRYRLYLLN